MNYIILNPEEISAVNATCRANGAVGANAVVPRIVRGWASKNDDILDYGAGSKAIHTKALREDGYKVTAWDIGKNFQSATHDLNALNKKYDIVYASNVINVQVNDSMLSRTLQEVSGLLRSKGQFIFNYPRSPRKLGLTDKEMTEVIKKHFKKVISLDGGVYIARNS